MVTTPPARVSRCLLITFSAAALAGCAKQPVLEGIGGAAPNPNGCYAFVYDQADWKGERAVLNGPSRWWSVERLRVDDKDWRNRIRSIEVGPTATVTLFTEVNYRGASQQFGPSSQPSRFDAGLSAGVESIAMTCRPNNP
jgi:hypothetical protein